MYHELICPVRLYQYLKFPAQKCALSIINPIWYVLSPNTQKESATLVTSKPTIPPSHRWSEITFSHFSCLCGRRRWRTARKSEESAKKRRLFLITFDVTNAMKAGGHSRKKNMSKHLFSIYSAAFFLFWIFRKEFVVIFQTVKERTFRNYKMPSSLSRPPLYFPCRCWFALCGKGAPSLAPSPSPEI